MHQRASSLASLPPRPALRLWRAPEEAVGQPADWAAWRLVLLAGVAPLVGLVALTCLFRWTAVDLSVGRLFYGGAGRAWPSQNLEPWISLYRWGPYPGLALGIAGACAAAVGLCGDKWRSWREAGLFLALALALGPGLVVNGIVKPQWGRPRPAQVKDFGGDQEFVGVWGFGSTRVSKSFPCGHASMGFYLMAPAFLFYPRRPHVAAAFLALGLVGGGVLGLARMAQGQHFASDVLWSGGLVYFSCLFLGYVFQRRSLREAPEPAVEAEPVILPWDGGRDAGVEEATVAAQVDGGAKRRAA